jgi:hypothetical protein
MRFHEVPWDSMRFHDVLVNRSVPTEANRGLTSYSIAAAAASPQNHCARPSNQCPKEIQLVQKMRKVLLSIMLENLMIMQFDVALQPCFCCC